MEQTDALFDNITGTLSKLNHTTFKTLDNKVADSINQLNSQIAPNPSKKRRHIMTTNKPINQQNCLHGQPSNKKNKTVFLTLLLSLAITPQSYVFGFEFEGSLKGVTITDSTRTNAPPNAVIDYSQDGGTVNFNASGSTDDGNIVEYSWNFSDGTFGTGAIVSHQFAGGSFPVTLTVFDDEGGAALSQVMIENMLNIAPFATATASTESGYGQLASNAIDQVIDGYPGDYTKEWATSNETVGAWITLTWAESHSIGKIILYDRPNPTDNILGGTFEFSDGSSVNFGELPSDGSGFTVSFGARNCTWVKMTTTSASGYNVGLAEIEVFGK